MLRGFTYTYVVVSKMEKAVDLLKGRGVDILSSLDAVSSCISQPFESTDDEQIHRNLGDNLARLGGGYVLTKFLQYLYEIYDSGTEMKHVLYGITLIRRTCRNYSEGSSKLCEQFGQAGLLTLMFSDIDRLNKEIQQKRKPAVDPRLTHMVWYHDMLPRAKASQLLQEDGDFLVRRKEDGSGQFVLSVKWGGTEKHILIKEQDQKYRFEGNGFTTVSDLIEGCVKSRTSVISSSQLLLKRPIVRRNIFGGRADEGAQLQQVIEDRTLAYRVWYHGCLSRVKTNELLKDDGDFLVRRKEDGSGQFVLSVKLDGTDIHFVIKERDHKYMFSFTTEGFDSICDLIEAYVKGEHPIQVSSRSSSTVVLKSPVMLRRGVHDSVSVANTDSCLQEAQRRWSLIMSAVVVLYHCAKVARNRQNYRDLRAIERLSPILKSEDLTLAMGAMLILSEIVEDQDVNILTADKHLIIYTLSTLKATFTNPKFEGNMKACAYSIADMSRALCNIAVNNKNKGLIVELGGVLILVDLLNQNRPDVQESAANTLGLLAHLERNKPVITSAPGVVTSLTSLQRSGNTAVVQAAKRALIKINPICQGIGRTAIAARGRCTYRDLCEKFKNSLYLADDYFEPQFDVCYCVHCHGNRGDDMYCARGQPPKLFGVPIGWCRFALKTAPKAKALNVFKEWHVAFHGTRLEAVKPILETGELLMPGDTRLGGEKLSECPGHFTDAWKPKAFDTKQIFLSPSIRYSGCDVYAPATEFTDASTEKSYTARVAFQVRINPKSYKVGPKTIDVTSKIDPKFSDQEIEWFTKERGAVILYGLLVKME
ncbi:uncharacterized protein [Ptychodera flava]|uniref:uncharacterized protein n=1 Tax=Ptychodera flava TaxID=63121 RepID=UPI00396A8047